MARYYRADSRRNARVSLEITGYAISSFLYLQRLTGDHAYFDAARRAADFLIDRGWDSGAQLFPFEYPRPGEEPCRHAYFFDTGIITRGLAAIARATGEARYLQAATLAGRSMIERFVTADRIYPIIDIASGRPAPEESRWAAQSGCYQLKAGLAWLELHEASGESAFLDAWEDCLDAALQTHEPFLPGEADQRKVMDRLHAYCYFLEGLTPVLGRKPCARAMAEGLDRVRHYLSQIAPEFERSDVWAQLLRLRILASQGGAVPLSQVHGEQEAGTAAAFQLTDTERAIDGGVYFGRLRGVFTPFVNPVSTGFTLQALAMWARRGQPGTQTGWHDLV